MLEVGDKVFPYLQKNLDDVIRIPDEELIGCFLDMVENHKMIVENSGLLTVAALKHLPAENKRVVSILSGGNMDVITMARVVQHGPIQRGRIFTCRRRLYPADCSDATVNKPATSTTHVKPHAPAIAQDYGGIILPANFSRLEYFPPFAKLFLPPAPKIRYSSANE